MSEPGSGPHPDKRGHRLPETSDVRGCYRRPGLTSIPWSWPDKHYPTCQVSRCMTCSAATTAGPFSSFTQTAIGTAQASLSMDTHVHLLVIPPEVEAIAEFMQKVERSYVGRCQARHGAPFNVVGRPLQRLRGRASKPYPARSAFHQPQAATRPHDECPITCPWSGCANHCGQSVDRILTPHPAYTAVGPTADARNAATASSCCAKHRRKTIRRPAPFSGRSVRTPARSPPQRKRTIPT